MLLLYVLEHNVMYSNERTGDFVKLSVDGNDQLRFKALLMVINILNPGRKWFLEFISGNYFQNLFTVVAKTDKLEQ